MLSLLSVSEDQALSPLVEVVEGLVAQRGRVVLGIAGEPGSGKTTLAEQLAAAYGRGRGAERVAHLPMDGFHLADIQLARLGLTDRKGAPETFDAAGYIATLQRILSASGDHDTIYAPAFERDLEQPIAQAVAIAATAELVITEGNYLLLRDQPWAGLAQLLDEIWYVQVAEELRLNRLLARHVQFGKSGPQARAWIDRVDEPNSALVRRERHRAARIVECGLDGSWRQQEAGQR